ncbi:hypothetical protein [Nonomuraea dietziae]|uniref:hypothetical protein n=1 Tax=Nonomuraea dietziae TaxID=65515 RepID=UPI0031E2E428
MKNTRNTGSRAAGGTDLPKWTIGSTSLASSGERPSSTPSATPAAAASAQPTASLARLGTRSAATSSVAAISRILARMVEGGGK